MSRTAIAIAVLLCAGCAGTVFAQGCYGCHTVGVVGTPLGPDLSGISTKYSRATLEAWLRDPAMQRPTAHMPKLELSEDEVRALGAFLVSLGQG